MLRFIKSLSRDERGVSALEYAILAAIVVAALVSVGTIFSSTSSGLPAIFTSLLAKITAVLTPAS
jgi:pilus assembly protein Flp/PilA